MDSLQPSTDLSVGTPPRSAPADALLGAVQMCRSAAVVACAARPGRCPMFRKLPVTSLGSAAALRFDRELRHSHEGITLSRK
jgi:hypothetical protein